MEFEEQITDAELVINTTPRVYVKWNNTEEGRDKKDCYERIVIGESVIYVNDYNKNSSVIYGHPFWDKLEKIYNDCINKENLNISDVSDSLFKLKQHLEDKRISDKDTLKLLKQIESNIHNLETYKELYSGLEDEIFNLNEGNTPLSKIGKHVVKHFFG